MPPAGDAPLVEPWSNGDGAGGFSHYVQPEHRAFVVEEAARRAEEQAALALEEMEVEEAVAEAMRYCVRHSLYDE